MKTNSSWYWLVPIAAISMMGALMVSPEPPGHRGRFMLRYIGVREHLHNYRRHTTELKRDPSTKPDTGTGSPQLARSIVEPEVDRYLNNLTELAGSINCTKMMDDIRFAPDSSMPLIALASFPRSGNTWTRYMMQVATQVYTTSVYWKTEKNMDSSRVLKGSTIDFTTRNGIMVKSHQYQKDHVRGFEGAILLIRNPYKSAVSEFFRVETFVKNLTKREAQRTVASKSDLWLRSAKSSFSTWHYLNLAWIRQSKRLLVVYYEDLVRNPIRELTRMIVFLGAPVNITRIQCAPQVYPWRDRHHLTVKPYYHPSLKRYLLDVNRTLVEKSARPLPFYR